MKLYILTALVLLSGREQSICYQANPERQEYGKLDHFPVHFADLHMAFWGNNS